MLSLNDYRKLKVSPFPIHSIRSKCGSSRLQSSAIAAYARRAAPVPPLVRRRLTCVRLHGLHRSWRPWSRIPSPASRGRPGAMRRTFWPGPGTSRPYGPAQLIFSVLHRSPQVFQAAFDRVAGVDRRAPLHRIVRFLEILHHAMPVARVLNLLIKIRATRSHNNVDRSLRMRPVPAHSGLVSADGQFGIVNGNAQLFMGLHQQIMSRRRPFFLSRLRR